MTQKLKFSVIFGFYVNSNTLFLRNITFMISLKLEISNKLEFFIDFIGLVNSGRADLYMHITKYFTSLHNQESKRLLPSSMYTKYCLILLIFITVLLYPLNVYGMDGTSNSNYALGYGMDGTLNSNYVPGYGIDSNSNYAPGYGMDGTSNSNYALGYGMDGTSNSNYAPGYGMDGTSNSNYGNKSKSIVVYDEQNKNELFVLFKGFVQIRKIKDDGKETLRSAKEYEVFMEIFCGDHVHDRHIFTDKYGKFEVVMYASDVKENFEKCKQGLNIGFYKYDPSKFQKIAKMVATGWQEKAEDVRRFFAKVDHFDCLMFSEKLTKNDHEKLEEEREKEKKENLFEYLNKQFTKQDDENSFQISFKSKYATINGKEAEILGDKAQYRSYAIYTQMKHSAQSESSSSENQLVKMYKKVTTCFGK